MTAKFNAARALASIDLHECACAGCAGALAVSEWPSWRRCAECGCMWRADTLHGRRYACTVANPRCPARTRAERPARPARTGRAA